MKIVTFRMATRIQKCAEHILKCVRVNLSEGSKLRLQEILEYENLDQFNPITPIIVEFVGFTGAPICTVYFRWNWEDGVFAPTVEYPGGTMTATECSKTLDVMAEVLRLTHEVCCLQ